MRKQVFFTQSHGTPPCFFIEILRDVNFYPITKKNEREKLNHKIKFNLQFLNSTIAALLFMFKELNLILLLLNVFSQVCEF